MDNADDDDDDDDHDAVVVVYFEDHPFWFKRSVPLVFIGHGNHA